MTPAQPSKEPSRSAVKLPRPCEASTHLRCGECLHHANRVVSLVGQKCPRCGLDYGAPKPMATRGVELKAAS